MIKERSEILEVATTITMIIYMFIRVNTLLVQGNTVINKGPNYKDELTLSSANNHGYDFGLSSFNTDK